MKQAKSLIIALVAATAPALALAQGTTGMTYEQFHHLDQDGSGAISEAEYRTFMEGAFKELDTDKNNSLSPDETANILTTDQFSLIDADGNGRVNRQEFLDHVMSEFHYHDSDKDGKLHP